MIQASNLEASSRVRHGFFTRRGGVSEGAFESLNCGFSSGDEEERVTVNRALAMQRLGLAPDSLATARQVHGVDVLLHPEPTVGRPAIVADALVTGRPGITLGVLSADCAPVLLADAGAGVIGAAHAGWRGALAGVIEATVAAMLGQGAARADIRAAIGPCIAQAAYEVGPEFFAQFMAEDPGSEPFFTAPHEASRRRFDLAGYTLLRLERAGIDHRLGLFTDTFTDEARFFSSRRTRVRGDEGFGLLLSAIALIP